MQIPLPTETVQILKGAAESSRSINSHKVAGAIESLLAWYESSETFDLVAHLKRQQAFSLRTFGPGARTAGVCDHIRKELKEIEAEPSDLEEWVDVILLAMDGAWRAGGSPSDIAVMIAAKQSKNEARSWPDWRLSDPNKAIEHVKPAEPNPAWIGDEGGGE